MISQAQARWWPPLPAPEHVAFQQEPAAARLTLPVNHRRWRNATGVVVVSVPTGPPRRSNPFRPSSRTVLRHVQTSPKPDDFKAMQQVSQTIFVAIVMGEKAVIHVVQVCALIDKGVAFNLGNSPGSCLAAHQVVLDSIG